MLFTQEFTVEQIHKLDQLLVQKAEEIMERAMYTYRTVGVLNPEKDLSKKILHSLAEFKLDVLVLDGGANPVEKLAMLELITYMVDIDSLMPSFKRFVISYDHEGGEWKLG